MSPETRVAVRLKLETNRELIPCTGIGSLKLTDARFSPHDALDVMTDFVRENIGLREIAAGSKPAPQLVVEPEIDVHPAVAGAIEGTRGRFGEAARRLDGVAKQNELRALVASLQRSLPDILRIVEHERHEVDQAFFLRRAADGTVRGDIHGFAGARRDYGEEVLTRDKTQNQKRSEPAKADGSRTAHPEAAGLAAAIFEIGASTA
jgi:hypothetical protein